MLLLNAPLWYKNQVLISINRFELASDQLSEAHLRQLIILCFKNQLRTPNDMYKIKQCLLRNIK